MTNPDRYSLDEIRRYWTDQAVEHGQSYAASWSDQYAIEMEITELLKWLDGGDNVFDVGCANGYSTIAFAAAKRLKLRGVDYIPEMIDQAKLHLSQVKSNLIGEVEFDVGDIMALEEPSASFDKVVVIRVVINLADWASQVKGIQECARVLKPGGLLLMSEATVQGWQQMNKFRKEWGLSEIGMPRFNLYLDQDEVVKAVASELELVDIVNFSSTYFVGTRILKPLLAQAAAAGVDVANPHMEWNRWFSQLSPAGDYGTQKLFVFKRKG